MENHSWVVVTEGPYKERDGVVKRTSASGWVRVKIVVPGRVPGSQSVHEQSFHPSQLKAG